MVKIPKDQKEAKLVLSVDVSVQLSLLFARPLATSKDDHAGVAPGRWTGRVCSTETKNHRVQTRCTDKVVWNDVLLVVQESAFNGSVSLHLKRVDKCFSGVHSCAKETVKSKIKNAPQSTNRNGPKILKPCSKSVPPPSRSAHPVG